MAGQQRVNPAQAIGIYYATPPTITDKDTGEVRLTSTGALVVANDGSVPTPPTTSPYSLAAIAVSSSGENTAITGTASQTIRVYKVALTAASPVTISFKDAAGGNVLGGTFQSVTTVMLDEFASGAPLYVGASAGNFIINLGTAVSVTGTLWYTKS